MIRKILLQLTIGQFEEQIIVDIEQIDDRN